MVLKWDLLLRPSGQKILANELWKSASLTGSNSKFIPLQVGLKYVAQQDNLSLYLSMWQAEYATYHNYNLDLVGLVFYNLAYIWDISSRI